MKNGDPGQTREYRLTDSAVSVAIKALNREADRLSTRAATSPPGNADVLYDEAQTIQAIAAALRVQRKTRKPIDNQGHTR